VSRKSVAGRPVQSHTIDEQASALIDTRTEVKRKLSGFGTYTPLACLFNIV